MSQERCPSFGTRAWQEEPCILADVLEERLLSSWEQSMAEDVLSMLVTRGRTGWSCHFILCGLLLSLFLSDDIL